jgi:glutamyl-tRNA reductase
VQLSGEEAEELANRFHGLRDRVPELAVLSTCNRTEVYSLARDPAQGDELVRRLFQDVKDSPHMNNGDYAYLLEGSDTVRHLFRVASGIESLMVGEPQILGQVREAFKQAERSQATGAILSRLFNSALHVGKRARTETSIGEGSVSVAYAAVDLALKVYEGLDRRTVAVLGAGDTGRLVATRMAEQRPDRLLVLNRTLERAADVAKELAGEAFSLDAWPEILQEADVVVAATSAPEPFIRSEAVEKIARARGTKPLVFVDISNPRNIDPGVRSVENVFLYDLDALEDIAEQNRLRRIGEVPQVEQIVDEEVRAFIDWYDALQVVPVLRSFRDHFHRIGESELASLRGLNDEERESMSAYTRALVNKLLHLPTTKIKGVDASTTQGLRKLVAIQELFELKLDQYGGGGSGEDDDA